MRRPDPHSTTGTLLTLVRQRPVELRLFGGDEVREVYRKFTRRHRFLVIRANTMGVGLQELPLAADNPFPGGRFKDLRQYRRKAQRLGYVVRRLEPLDHLDDIMAIHRSAESRQGRPMDAMYLDEAAVRAYCQRPGAFFGVFDGDGVLAGYAHTPVLGDIVLFSRLLGRGDRKRDPFMFLLLSEVLVEMAQQRDRVGYPEWAMYDMFLGAHEGLRTFKRHLGFEPRRVKWRLVQPPPTDSAETGHSAEAGHSAPSGQAADG